MTINVLGFAGSLRQGSYNRALLRAAQMLTPEAMTITIFELHDIPLYNADIDTDELRPKPVTMFKQAIADADALLIASPEYNHSTSGVLKNAIDWASRPARSSPMADKPAAIMGASGGMWGTSRSTEDLRLLLDVLGMWVVKRPGVLVARAGEKFDDDLTLTHEQTRGFIADLLENLAALTERMAT